jgi:hypothetical protein
LLARSTRPGFGVTAASLIMAQTTAEEAVSASLCLSRFSIFLPCLAHYQRSLAFKAAYVHRQEGHTPFQAGLVSMQRSVLRQS